MFKFIKEMIGSVKEGIAEAKEEMAQEALEAAENPTSKEDVANIPKAEAFGTALGAPFRVINFDDWFSLFDKEKGDNDYPIHLYQFGSYPKLEEKKKEFQQLLNRDFNITDRSSCTSVLHSFFDLIDINQSETILEDVDIDEPIDIDLWDISLPGVNALAIAVISHIITAGTDSGFLTKEDALPMLVKVNQYATSNFNDWNDFSDKFLIGDENVGLNGKMGKKLIVKHMSYLKEKKGSPWNNIAW